MAIYLQAMAMLRKGLPEEAACEVFVKALSEVDPQQLMDWVRELLPAHVTWFERMVG
jgi:hypothetical protein